MRERGEIYSERTREIERERDSERERERERERESERLEKCRMQERKIILLAMLVMSTTYFPLNSRAY